MSKLKFENIIAYKRAQLRLKTDTYRYQYSGSTYDQGTDRMLTFTIGEAAVAESDANFQLLKSIAHEHGAQYLRVCDDGFQFIAMPNRAVEMSNYFDVDEHKKFYDVSYSKNTFHPTHYSNQDATTTTEYLTTTNIYWYHTVPVLKDTYGFWDLSSDTRIKREAAYHTIWNLGFLPARRVIAQVANPRYYCSQREMRELAILARSMPALSTNDYQRTIKKTLRRYCRELYITSV